MTTTNKPANSKRPTGVNERRGVSDRERLSLFAELTVESTWSPTERPPVASEGWLRANGYAPDRRTNDEPSGA